MATWPGALVQPARRVHGARTLDWPAVAAVLVLAAVVRALRIWSNLIWHHDDILDAIPAIQILQGTFPLYHVAVEYAGASKAYPLAVWFALAGTSSAALDAFGYLVGLVGVWTSLLVARRLLPPGAALCAGLVLAVPSLHAVTWAIGGNLLYPVTILIGNLLLLVTHAIFFRRPGRPGLVLVAGVLAGIGLWTNPLIVVFCVPFALLALRTGLVWRASVWLFPLGVLLGGLPDWIYDVVNYPSAKLLVGQSGSVPAEPFVTRLRLFLGEIVPRLYGASSEPGFAPPLIARAAVVGLGALVHCPRRGPGPGGAPMAGRRPWRARPGARPAVGLVHGERPGRAALEAPAGRQLSGAPLRGPADLDGRVPVVALGLSGAGSVGSPWRPCWRSISGPTGRSRSAGARTRPGAGRPSTRSRARSPTGSSPAGSGTCTGRPTAWCPPSSSATSPECE